MKALEILKKRKSTLLLIKASLVLTKKELIEIDEEIKDHDEAIAELEALQQPKSCEWHLGDYDQNLWISKCGAEFILIEGIPSENGMNFCHKCGGKLIQLETEKDEEDEHE